MQLTFTPIDRDQALAISSWSYPAPYQVYGYSQDTPAETIQYFTDPKNQIFAVTSHQELVGFRSFGPDAQVPGGDYHADYLDTGGGLRPDLTGKGLGPDWIRQGLRFGAGHFSTNRFRVTIADFNQRAQAACEKAGFQKASQFKRPSDAQPFTLYTIDLSPSL